MKTPRWVDKEIQFYKDHFDRKIEKSFHFSSFDLGPLSLFYLQLALISKDDREWARAEQLRDLAAVSLIQCKEEFSAIDSPYANHLSLKIWSEIGRPSAIWQDHLPLARRSLEAAALKTLRKPDRYELFYGATGVALIAYQIGHHALVRKALSHLKSLMIKTDWGRMPQAPEWYLQASFKIKSKEKLFLPGISHGVAGPVLLLRWLENDTRYRKIARELGKTLSSSLTQMIKQFRPSEGEVRVHDLYPPPLQRPVNLVSWCSGAIGTGFALSNSPSGKKIIKTARLAQKQVLEAHVCHGAAGVAQIFYRLKLKDKKHDRAFREWLRALRRPNRYTSDCDRFQLLLGPLGPALLLANLKLKQPIPWDRQFLLCDLTSCASVR